MFLNNYVVKHQRLPFYSRLQAFALFALQEFELFNFAVYYSFLLSFLRFVLVVFCELSKLVFLGSWVNNGQRFEFEEIAVVVKGVLLEWRVIVDVLLVLGLLVFEEFLKDLLLLPHVDAHALRLLINKNTMRNLIQLALIAVSQTCLPKAVVGVGE